MAESSKNTWQVDNRDSSNKKFHGIS